MSSKHFIHCEKCGKRLIERMEDGGFCFKFGTRKDAAGNSKDNRPVEMYIYGSVKLKCLSEGCETFNTLHFLPNVVPNAKLRNNTEASGE